MDANEAIFGIEILILRMRFLKFVSIRVHSRFNSHGIPVNSTLASTSAALLISAMPRIASILIWIAVSLLGATAVAIAAFQRNEPVNALWLVIAGVCTFAVAYRFYSAWLMAKVLTIDDRRAPAAVTCSDGKDFVPTPKWVVFGHHFAAIAGPGPLVGPVLAAQFGYLPGTLWILVGATLGGGVHDAVILFASMRRNGKSLGQMLKEELNPVIGLIAIESRKGQKGQSRLTNIGGGGG